MSSPPTDVPHSADYFGDFRDFWWHRDFLQLMARRLGLSEVRSVLDVGCGVGHWGQVLSSVMTWSRRESCSARKR